MQNKRKQYTQEFRDSAVKLITEQGYKIPEAARNLGVNKSVLGRWKREAEEGGGPGSAQEKDDVHTTELVRLKKENQRLRMEREILKKDNCEFNLSMQQSLKVYLLACRSSAFF
ncbi:MAG: transposase [Desulfobulbaceae bacterium]|nr:transposase [Desulfobulbaceae bacterium]